jgi:hypothetical protein
MTQIAQTASSLSEPLVRAGDRLRSNRPPAHQRYLRHLRDLRMPSPLLIQRVGSGRGYRCQYDRGYGLASGAACQTSDPCKT